MNERGRSPRWRPVHVGLFFAGMATVLIGIGVLRGNVPLSARALGVALLVGAGSWGFVSWLVAAAMVDVENDIIEEDNEDR